MNFQPVIPSGGLVGWRFLQRTYDAQLQSYSASNVNQRETDYFLENIGKVQSAEDLVSDRRLLQVALGAFGLEADLDNRFFIQKILSDGTQAEDALANRLADGRYRDFANAFGLGPGDVRKTGLTNEMEKIASDNLVARFEISVGEADESMRIALFTQHALQEIAAQDGSENRKWFDLMGLPPLRSMMETALGLPSAFAQLDIDKQLEVFRDRLQRVTGSSDLSQFTDSEAIGKLTDTYLARSQIAQLQRITSPAQTALILLGGGN
ncbi:flagellar protein, putative [Rhodobacteraceae bacterium KLH11]|nr:flagellar protein, putative [Rhodobacteraceae bacterium KLH11]